MRSGRLPAALLLVVICGACGTSSSSEDPSNGIHPQPQPTNGKISITAPCNVTTCGPAPTTFQYPRCRPVNGACTWSDQVVASYQPCDDAACGPAPSTDGCPPGTTFASNTCGSENDDSCRWTTGCAQPKSTTPCPDPKGCGEGVPDIAAVCDDGTYAGLACFQLANGTCGFQPNCP